MKKIYFTFILALLFISVSAQDNKIQTLQNLEGTSVSGQDQGITAKLKYASRLFKDKDDLTSVIMVVPADSTVEVLASDSTFLRVSYEGNEGFIYSHQAEINRPFRVTKPAPLARQQSQAGMSFKRIEPKTEGRAPDRYTYLASKYGPSMGTRLYEGKVWKGMKAEMVQDAWGSPRKINRVISNSNETEEQWFYNRYWLSLRNGIVVGWGAVK